MFRFGLFWCQFCRGGSIILSWGVFVNRFRLYGRDLTIVCASDIYLDLTRRLQTKRQDDEKATLRRRPLDLLVHTQSASVTLKESAFEVPILELISPIMLTTNIGITTIDSPPNPRKRKQVTFSSAGTQFHCLLLQCLTHSSLENGDKARVKSRYSKTTASIANTSSIQTCIVWSSLSEERLQRTAILHLRILRNGCGSPTA